MESGLVFLFFVFIIAVFIFGYYPDFSNENKNEIEKNNNNSETNSNSNVCPYCKQQVVIDATKCPHCGEWLKKDSRIGCFGILNIIAIVLSILSGIIYSAIVPAAAPFLIIIIISLRNYPFTYN